MMKRVEGALALPLFYVENLQRLKYFNKGSINRARVQLFHQEHN